MDVERIRRLAGLQGQNMDSDTEADRLYDERRSRERKITKLIDAAFTRLWLHISDDGIFYDEDSDREAIITLYDSEADLATLARLIESGLANRYTVWGNSNELLLRFKVNPELDQAVA